MFSKEKWVIKNNLFIKSLLAFVAAGVLSAHAEQTPRFVTFDGVLTDTTGIAVTTAKTVEFAILAPIGTCVLYSETASITPSDDGSFSHQVGTGTTSFGVSVKDAFKNAGSKTCTSGSYTPTPTDGRRIRVSIDGIALDPMMEVGSVPYAAYADHAVSADNFSGNISTGQISSGVLGIARGGTGVATPPSNGQILIGNGSGFSLANLSAGTGVTISNTAGGVSISASGSGGDITGVAAGDGLTGGGASGDVTLSIGAGTGISVTADAIAVDVGTTANKILQLDSSARLPIVDGSQLTGFTALQIPNLSAEKITSGTLTLARGGTGLSAITGGNRILGANSAGNALEYKALTAAGGVAITHEAGGIQISSTSGTVTSVGLLLPNIFSVAGSPITSSGSLTASLVNQNPNMVWAGPSTSGGAPPSFRSLVEADIPSLSMGKFTTGTLGLARGGTGASLNATSGGVLFSSASSLGITPAGTTGSVLVSYGSSAPGFSSSLIISGSRLGIGKASPTSIVDVEQSLTGLESPIASFSSSSTRNLAGSPGEFTDFRSVGTMTAGGAGSSKLYGFYGSPQLDSGGGEQNKVYGLYVAPSVVGTSNLSSTSVVGVYSYPTKPSGNPAQVYSGIFLGGNVGIGTEQPKAKFEVNGRASVQSLTEGITNSYVLISPGNSHTITDTSRNNVRIAVAPNSVGSFFQINLPSFTYSAANANSAQVYTLHVFIKNPTSYSTHVNFSSQHVDEVLWDTGGNLYLMAGSIAIVRLIKANDENIWYASKVWSSYSVTFDQLTNDPFEIPNQPPM